MIRSTLSFLNFIDYVMAFLSGEFEIIKSNRECDGLGFVRFTRGLGRKRILISNSDLAPANDSSSPEESQRSLLESLHQDILVCSFNFNSLCFTVIAISLVNLRFDFDLVIKIYRLKYFVMWITRTYRHLNVYRKQ